ncbi:MAG: hypothetical protein ABWZ99_13775 [Ilumatobacteraceae bacterium]
MSESVTLETVKEFAAGLSMWAHLATVGADNRPDPDTGLLAITPQRALILEQYGIGGARGWTAA